MEGVWPWACTQAALRRLSTGTVDDEPKLWRNPSVWPISWEETKRMSCHIKWSSNFIVRALGSTLPVWIMYQECKRLITL